MGKLVYTPSLQTKVVKMRPLNALRWLLAIAFFVGMSALATADRKPTPDERAKIETVLREQGFTRWKDIEFDDDDKVWEVDDAVGSDGREYHLKLDVNSLAIVKREPSSSSNRGQ